MKKIILLFLPVFMVLSAHATHISYEDLTYKWISGLTYEFTLTLYRDCYPGSAAAPTSVTLSICSVAGTSGGNIVMPQVAGTGNPVFPVCSNPLSYCAGGTDTGFQKYIYKATHTMISARSDWRIFHAYCCREGTINTISGPLVTGTGIVVSMDNLNFPGNSSPVFNDEPVLFACCNQSYSYNQSATDIDGDSLVYSLYYPLSDSPYTVCATMGTVTYLSGYNYNSFITSSPAISMNPLTGYLTMYPTVCSEVSVMGVKVEEYRAGVLIGSITRDNMVIVTNQTAGVPEPERNLLSVFPNPATDKFFVNSPVNGELRLVNILGQWVEEGSISGQKEIDLSGFSSGIYIIQLRSKNGISTRKIIKQ